MDGLKEALSVTVHQSPAATLKQGRTARPVAHGRMGIKCQRHRTHLIMPAVLTVVNRTTS